MFPIEIRHWDGMMYKITLTYVENADLDDLQTYFNIKDIPGNNIPHPLNSSTYLHCNWSGPAVYRTVQRVSANKTSFESREVGCTYTRGMRQLR